MCLKDRKKTIADFTHLRKPRVFGPLRSPKEPRVFIPLRSPNNYSGSGVDRKPLACEDVLNDV